MNWFTWMVTKLTVNKAHDTFNDSANTPTEWESLGIGSFILGTIGWALSAMFPGFIAYFICVRTFGGFGYVIMYAAVILMYIGIAKSAEKPTPITGAIVALITITIITVRMGALE